MPITLANGCLRAIAHPLLAEWAKASSLILKMLLVGLLYKKKQVYIGKTIYNRVEQHYYSFVIIVK
jgi:hypothetical protein